MNSNEDQRHKQDIDALLKAAEEEQPVSQTAHFHNVVETQPNVQQSFAEKPVQNQKAVDWDDDEIFDELLAAVPNSKTATDVHSPFNISEADVSAPNMPTSTVAAVAAASAVTQTATFNSAQPKNIALETDFDGLDDLLVEDDVVATRSNPVTEQPVRTASSYAQSTSI